MTWSRSVSILSTCDGICPGCSTCELRVRSAKSRCQCGNHDVVPTTVEVQAVVGEASAAQAVQQGTPVDDLCARVVQPLGDGPAVGIHALIRAVASSGQSR